MIREGAGSRRALAGRWIVGAIAWLVIGAALLIGLSYTLPAPPVQNDVVYA